jgi:hypothetical protein
MVQEEWISFSAVYGGSGDDVYAAGGEKIAHYDGLTWSISDTGCGCGLVDIWVSRDGYAVAVGGWGGGMGVNYTATEYKCDR